MTKEVKLREWSSPSGLGRREEACKGTSRSLDHAPGRTQQLHLAQPLGGDSWPWQTRNATAMTMQTVGLEAMGSCRGSGVQ